MDRGYPERCRSEGLRLSSPRIDTDEEFLRGPLWRVRTSPTRRRIGAAITFGLIAIVGTAAMVGAMALLAAIDAPPWVVAAPWLVPTVGVIVWTVRGPQPAIVTDDDDDPWTGYTIRLVVVGEDEANSTPVRVGAALVLGGPVGWALGVLLVLELVGLV